MKSRPGKAGRRRWGAMLVKFVQYYLDCLSQASYLIGDETSGRAAVVDPRRDVQEYLFIGDVGRPDLVAAQGRTPEEMAAELYRSLHARVLTLPDATRVYPAHGAGSACGKNLSTETVSTLGEQRRSNYALRLGSAGEFVAAVTEGQPPRPGYFARVAELNREAHQLADVEEPV